MATFRVTGKLTNGQPIKAVKVEAQDALHAATPFAQLVAASGQTVAFDTVKYTRVHVKNQKFELGEIPKPAETKPTTPSSTKKAGK